MSTMDDPAMEDPMFQVGHADGGTPDERAIAGEMSRAERAATREEHVGLAEDQAERARREDVISSEQGRTRRARR